MFFLKNGVIWSVDWGQVHLWMEPFLLTHTLSWQASALSYNGCAAQAVNRLSRCKCEPDVGILTLYPLVIDCQCLYYLTVTMVIDHSLWCHRGNSATITPNSAHLHLRAGMGFLDMHRNIVLIFFKIDLLHILWPCFECIVLLLASFSLAAVTIDTLSEYRVWP